MKARWGSCSICVALAATTALTAAAQAEVIYATTTNNQLIAFDSSTPSAITSGVAIAGLASNEEVVGIDFRPATGQLYALGSFSNLYTLNPNTGAASQVGSTFNPSLSGAWFSFDFNPTIDRIRSVSDANRNLVLNPNDGASTRVTDLFFAAGDLNQGRDATIAHSAYTNNFNDSTVTQLFGIDTNLDILVTQANNTGVLGTVGSLGLDIDSFGGFDVSGTTGTAFAALLPNGGSSQLYTVNLGTGMATAIDTIGGGFTVTAMSVTPEPSSLSLLLLASLGLVIRR